ncbi:MAG TPA: Xaa-Pro peptidase family protein [Terriglobales bacterium]|nr:Xaa-Pro peptidase family protein [Terriglobales bacterium]
MDHKGQLKKLRTVFESNSLDALLVTHLPNIRYLCGFTGTSGVLAIFETGSVFLTDGRYREQARAEVQGARIVIAHKPPLAAAAEWLMENRSKLGRKKPRRLGIESEHLTVAGRSQLASLLRPDFRLRETRGLVERCRMVKDAEEIALLRAAAALGASLFDRALEVIRPGVKETEVAAEMEYAARRAGAEEMSFPTIVAAGKRSALPHGRASRAAIPSRGFVVCDFGVILSGYCSDRTRTVHVGRLTVAARRMYEAVREAQAAAIETVRAGVSVSEVDRAARNILANNGLARHFTHSTGHGVGLEIHEAPRIAMGQTEILRPGMVITVEPGVYIAGSGGVRIEDVVVVTEQGCEVLAPSNKELITI